MREGRGSLVDCFPSFETGVIFPKWTRKETKCPLLGGGFGQAGGAHRIRGLVMIKNLCTRLYLLRPQEHKAMQKKMGRVLTTHSTIIEEMTPPP